jgi:hypothetical protein
VFPVRAVRSDRSPENDARVVHGRRDYRGICRFLRETLRKEIAPGTPGIQSSLHRRCCNGKVVEAERGLVGLEFPCHPGRPHTQHRTRECWPAYTRRSAYRSEQSRRQPCSLSVSRSIVRSVSLPLAPYPPFIFKAHVPHNKIMLSMTPDGRGSWRNFSWCRGNVTWNGGHLLTREFVTRRLVEQSKLPHATALPARHDQVIEQRDA